jgi:dTDP-4-dehydrorhamnose reductase
VEVTGLDRVAVLGGSGFLGAHVAARAFAAGARDVVSIGRNPRVLGPARERTRAVIADALHAGELESALERERPSHVILCTALSRMADCDAYPLLAEQLNVELPRRVASWCAANGARLIHVSTDLVFGAFPPPPCGFLEHHAPAPISRYGASKAGGELAVLDADTRALVVRLPLLYGDSFGRGQGASDSLFGSIARNERPLLFTDELRTPLDVAEAAPALIELARSDRSGIAHLAGARKLSRFEFGLELLRSRGVSDREARSRVRAGRRSDSGLDGTRPADVALGTCHESARGKRAAQG